MAQYQFLDELVREYVLFRGFTATLRAFDLDLKLEKEKGFRVDRILEQLSQLISAHELTGLLDLWRHLDTRIFSKLDTAKAAAVRKLENSVLKLYAVACVQNRQLEKLREFFEKVTPEIQSQAEWKEWFSLPYIRDPQENPAFSIFFSRHWQDTLMLSLHNFLALAFQALPPPRLADYQKTSARIRLLKEEIKSLKLKVAQAGLDEDMNLSQGNLRYFEPPPPQEIMEDFFLIAQETEKTDSQVKSIKSFLRNFTGQTERKKSPRSETQRSVSKSRQPPTSLGIVKPPLKRASQSVKAEEPADQLNVTGEEEERPAAAAAEQGDQLATASNLTSTAEKQWPGSLLATPATPGTRYLLLGQEEFHEHRSAVSALQVSPGGLIASADASGVVKVWVPTPSTPPSATATFISASPVTCLAWVDDRRLLYGTSSGQVRLCDVEDKCLVMENTSTILGAQAVTVLSCSPSPGANFFCASQQRALIFNTKTFVLERDLTKDCEVCSVTAAAYNHNSSLLVYGGEEGKLGLADLNRGEVLASWQGHERAVTCLSLAQDETAVWSLGREGSLLRSSLVRPGERLWAGCLGPPPPHGLVSRMAVAPDGDHILASTEAGGVVYRVGEEGLVKILGLRGHHPVTMVCWVPGECGPVLTAALDGNVKIFTLLSQ